ncbi:MAG: SRPBCC domain-containing protein [Hyphomonadaceae bacterium]
MRIRAIAAALVLCATPAAAEVTAAQANHFVSRHSALLTAAPGDVWRDLGLVGRWWNSEHTYSGEARNMRVSLRAGACWCETWAGGSVEHGRVVYAQPNATLRILGALGPLQEMGVSGVLTYTLAAEGDGTRLTMTYRVDGSGADDLSAIAPLVDGVMGEQFARLARYAQTGAAED